MTYTRELVMNLYSWEGQILKHIKELSAMNHQKGNICANYMKIGNLVH